MLHLIYKHPHGNRIVFPLAEGATVTVGRSPDCDLVLDHGSVSRNHLLVMCRRGKVYVCFPVGTKPTNGSIVDGLKLNEGEILEVKDGCTLTCGAVELDIRDTESFSKTIEALREANSVEMSPCIYGPPSMLANYRPKKVSMPQPFAVPCYGLAPIYGVPADWMPDPAPMKLTPAPVNASSQNQRDMAPVYGPPLNQQPPIPPKPMPQTTISSVNAVGYGPPSFWDRGLLDKVKVRSLTCPALSPGFIIPDEINTKLGEGGQFQRQQGVVQASAPDVNSASAKAENPESNHKTPQTFAEQNNSANAPECEKTDNSEDDLNK